MAEKNIENDYLLKINLLGSDWKLRGKLIDSVTGYISDPNSIMPTLGIDISGVKITVKNSPVKLILVNTASQEFFGKLRHSYYRGASACTIVFDKSDRKSFDEVPNWLEEFRKYLPIPNLPIALLGINTNEEEVSTDEGKALAELLELPYFETSSPKFENAHEVFEYLAKKAIGIEG